MINLELTPKIKEWLDTPAEQRDLQAGATLLLRVTRNRILYNNVTRNLRKSAPVIEYQLGKILKQRLIGITHEQVRGMMEQVEAVNQARGLDKPQTANRTEFQKGKRADHDQLPEEIQALYDRNTEILIRMRECHTSLRMINEENSSCPDNDRYPFAKELLSLDAQYRSNWNVYDHYIKGTPVAKAEEAVDPRTASKNAAKLCTLLLGRYAKAPDDALADRIKEAYAKVLTPTENLQRKMKAAGLL